MKPKAGVAKPPKADYRKRLARVLKAKDSAPLITLDDARAYMLTIPEPEASREVWQYAVAKVMFAAEQPTKEKLEAATHQIELALFLMGRTDFAWLRGKLK